MTSSSYRASSDRRDDAFDPPLDRSTRLVLHLSHRNLARSLPSVLATTRNPLTQPCPRAGARRRKRSRAAMGTGKGGSAGGSLALCEDFDLPRP
jgi:hypothetical protein